MGDCCPVIDLKGKGHAPGGHSGWNVKQDEVNLHLPIHTVDVRQVQLHFRGCDRFIRRDRLGERGQDGAGDQQGGAADVQGFIQQFQNSSIFLAHNFLLLLGKNAQNDNS
jgi:hypothetical protein